jgi:hypothetical protein
MCSMRKLNDLSDNTNIGIRGAFYLMYTSYKQLDRGSKHHACKLLTTKGLAWFLSEGCLASTLQASLALPTQASKNSSPAGAS